MNNNQKHHSPVPAFPKWGLMVGLVGLVFLGLSQTIRVDAETVVAPPDYLRPEATIPQLTPGSYPASDPTGFLQTLKFLNSSASPQQKAGTLTVGLGVAGEPIASICLNSDPESPATDPTNCVSNWDTFRTTSSVGKIPVKSTTDPSQFLANPVRGFMRVKADSTQPFQQLTVVASAPPSSVAYPKTIGLYAKGTTVDTSYAALFSGKTFIGSYSFGITKKLCLNNWDQISGPINPGSSVPLVGCISRWADLFLPSGGTDYLTLQPAQGQVAIETGQISTSGSVHLGAMIAGSAAGLPIPSTCGDGVCNGNEPATPALCPIDCASVYSPAILTAHAAVNLTTGVPYIAFSTRTWSTAASQRVMVLRKTGSPPLGAPMQGVSYDVNASVGDATVVYVSPGLVGANQPFPGFSTNANGITAGQTYYYVAYGFNAMYRYSRGLMTSVAMPDSVPVTFTFTYANAGFLDISVVNDGTYYSESAICTTTCTKRAIPGTQIDLLVEAVNANYCMNGYSGLCTTTQPGCRFTVPASGGSVAVNFGTGSSCQSGGGGGGGEDPPPIIRGGGS